MRVDTYSANIKLNAEIVELTDWDWEMEAYKAVLPILQKHRDARTLAGVNRSLADSPFKIDRTKDRTMRRFRMFGHVECNGRKKWCSIDGPISWQGETLLFDNFVAEVESRVQNYEMWREKYRPIMAN